MMIDTDFGVPSPSPLPSGAQGRFSARLQVPLLAGLLLGIGGGTLAGLYARSAEATVFLMRWVVKPVEQAFMLAMFLLIVPLLVSALVSGVVRLRTMAGTRRLLLSILVHMFAASLAAALIGLAMANLFRPGDVVPAEIGQQLLSVSPPAVSGTWLDAAFSYTQAQRWVVLVILGSGLAGLVLTFLRSGQSGRALARSERVYAAAMRMLERIARLTPLVVACFMFDLTLVFGWHLLLYLSAYVAVVVAALLLQVGLTFFAVVWMRGGLLPLAFLRGVQEPAVIAFCTSSSNATLPSALRAAEQDLALPAREARLVMSVGTIANQGGTAIYTAVTVLFIAQFFGMDLSLAEQGLVLGVATLAGMGTIGVPAGSLPTVAGVLALTGLPAGGIGLVVGVDRLLDMFRTMVNVVGDIAIAIAVAREPQASSRSLEERG